MPRPDEGLIHAWLDGELGAEEAARVEKLVAEDLEWAAAAAEARGLIAASSRILGALDVVPGDVIPKGGSAAPALRAPGRVMPTWMKVAAGFALVAGVSYAVRSNDEAVMQMVTMEEAPRDAQAVPQSAQSAVAEPAPLIVTVPNTSGGRGDVASNAVPAAPSPAPVRAKVAEEITQDAARDRAESRVAAATGASMNVPMTAPANAAPTVMARAVVVADSVSSAKKSAETELALERQRASRDTRLGQAAVANTRAVDDARRGVAAKAALEPQAFDRAAPAPAPAASRLAADLALAETRVLTGCWRVATPARVDSIQSSPRILSQTGDTLVLALTPAGVQAQVVLESERVLRGTVRDSTGTRATLVADRMACPQP